MRNFCRTGAIKNCAQNSYRVFRMLHILHLQCSKLLTVASSPHIDSMVSN